MTSLPDPIGRAATERPELQGKGFGSRGGAETQRDGGAEILCGPRPEVILDYAASGPEEAEGALRTRPAPNLSAPPLLLRASA